MSLKNSWPYNNPPSTPPGNPYKDNPTPPNYGPGDVVTIGPYSFTVQGAIAPVALPDLAPFINQRLKKYRFFGSGSDGVAICDFTPVRAGTKTKLGAF